LHNQTLQNLYFFFKCYSDDEVEAEMCETYSIHERDEECIWKFRLQRDKIWHLRDNEDSYCRM